MAGKTKIPLSSIDAGMILANNIVSDDGELLLSRGLQLTAEHIVNLERWNVHFVDIVSGSDLDSKEYCGDDGISKKEREFNEFYRETLQMTRRAFETTYLSKHVPIDTINKLVDCHIGPLIDEYGALEFLYNIRVHCDYTYRHSINVAIVSGIIGKSIGMKKDQLRTVVMAGLLHDIGKLSITTDILHKPGKLTEQEMMIIKNHPWLGYQILVLSNQLCDDVKFGVLQHHERIDGSGYPQGLGQNKIHRYAKVIAVADIYDAMTTERVYRRKLTPFCVAETIAQQMYRQLDPEVCLPFLKDIKTNLSNSIVLLNNGQKGEVVYIHTDSLERPMVRLADGTFLNLDENKEIEITEIANW